MLLNHNIQNDDCLLIAQKVTTVSCRSCMKLGPFVPWSQTTVCEYRTRVKLRQNQNAWRKDCASAPTCTTNPIWTTLGLNPALQREAMIYDEVISHHKVCIVMFTVSHADVHHIHSPVSSSSASSLSDSKVLSGISYSRIIGLLGSFIMRYFPSFCFMQISTIQRRIPHALSIFSVICVANSFGLYCCVPKITCLDESRT